MIYRIMIDNYKCFSDFTFDPKPFELFLGANGAGKTTILDVLETLRDHITMGVDTIRGFPPHTRTAWGQSLMQHFNIGLQGNGGDYSYTLAIEHDPDGKSNRIEHEELTFNSARLYEYDSGVARLYREDDSVEAEFPFDSSRSPLPSLPERGDTDKLTWFRARMEKMHVFSPDPLRMTSLSKEELERPDRSMHNFASWLRHMSQERMSAIPELVKSLKEVFDGFKGIRLEKSGNARELKFDFDFQGEPDGPSGEPYTLLFEQLSEGQRNLTVLSAIISAVVQKDTTVCIDELDNFVALREIQPLLILLKDKVDDESSQCFLVSHNSEVMNYLAAHYGSTFYRDDGGPTRVKRFEYKGEDPMLPSEVIANGWD